MQDLSWCNRKTLQESSWNDVSRLVSSAVRTALERVLESLDGAVLSREECSLLAYATGDDLYGLTVSHDLR